MSFETKNKDLPFFVHAIIPWLILPFLFFLYKTDFQAFHDALAKDRGEKAWATIVEHLTVAILIPGIIMGTVALIFNRSSELLSDVKLKVWITLSVLACVYFAGEEASWGQWYFGWATPDSLKEINDQQETNLHNTSSWFDQKPRALVEAGIYIGGFIWPLLYRFKKIDLKKPFLKAIVPTYACFSCASLVILIRILEKIDFTNPFFKRLTDTSELREYFIAIFLCYYLLSYWSRSRTTQTNTEATS